MGDVASHGRTIIFVSHNMQAVQSLCKSAIYLKSGQLEDAGQTEKVITNYLNKDVKNCLFREWNTVDEAPGNSFIKLVRAEVQVELANPNDPITVSTSLRLHFDFINYTDDNQINLSLLLYTSSGVCIFNVGTSSVALKKGKQYSSTLDIPGNLLNDDIYTVNLLFVKNTSVILYAIEELLTFEVFDDQRDGNWYGKWLGAVRPKLNFTLT